MLNVVIYLYTYTVLVHYTLIVTLAAFAHQDFNFTYGTQIVFADVESIKSMSREELVVSVINDNIA